MMSGFGRTHQPGGRPFPDASRGVGSGRCALVGRIRTDVSDPGGRSIARFLVDDQLAKSAALNAVQIAERWVG